MNVGHKFNTLYQIRVKEQGYVKLCLSRSIFCQSAYCFPHHTFQYYYYLVFFHADETELNKQFHSFSNNYFNNIDFDSEYFCKIVNFEVDGAEKNIYQCMLVLNLFCRFNPQFL